VKACTTAQSSPALRCRDRFARVHRQAGKSSPAHAGRFVVSAEWTPWALPPRFRQARPFPIVGSLTGRCTLGTRGAGRGHSTAEPKREHVGFSRGGVIRASCASEGVGLAVDCTRVRSLAWGGLRGLWRGIVRRDGLAWTCSFYPDATQLDSAASRQRQLPRVEVQIASGLSLGRFP